MQEYKVIAKGVPGYLIIKAENETAAMLLAQSAGLRVTALMSVRGTKEGIDACKKDAIRLWCELDNIWGRLEKRIIKCFTDKVCNAIQTDIDSARHAVMQSCGIEDYCEMSSLAETVAAGWSKDRGWELEEDNEA